MSGPWNDFNSAQSNTNVIPKGTLAKVRLTLRPGGFDDPAQGWTGGWARRAATGAVYLDAEYTVLEGPFARRKIWSLIGLHSPKGPDWANMGRGLIRGILNSARGVSDKDNSPEAQAHGRSPPYCAQLGRPAAPGADAGWLGWVVVVGCCGAWPCAGAAVNCGATVPISAA